MSDLPDDEFWSLHAAVNAEGWRRVGIDTVQPVNDRVNRAVFMLKGFTPGAQWVRPTSPDGGYPVGWEVTHDGVRWASMEVANMSEPNPEEWREVTGVG